MRSMIAAAVRGVVPDVDVVECESGLAALRVIPQLQLDLILTDIHMPDLTGLELIQFLRSHKATETVPLVIVSSEGSPRDRQKGLALGADEYVIKPFTTERLQEVVRRFLGA